MDAEKKSMYADYRKLENRYESSFKIQLNSIEQTSKGVMINQKIDMKVASRFS